MRNHASYHKCKRTREPRNLYTDANTALSGVIDPNMPDRWGIDRALPLDLDDDGKGGSCRRGNYVT